MLGVPRTRSARPTYAPAVSDREGRSLPGGAPLTAAQLRLLADSLPQLVWTAGPDGVVDYYNSRVADYGGWMGPDGGYDWQPLVHPEDLEGTLAAWAAASAAGREYEHEHRVQMADGGYRWHLSRALPLRDREGAIVKWFGTATDVHERRMAEQRVADLAQALQRALLPERLPTVAGVELASQYRPASDIQEVGGDWYDAVVSDGGLDLVIGDVAGHGVESAAVMGAARHAVAGSLMSSEGPAESLRAANAYLASLGDLFVTCCAVRADLSSGELVVASAGHPPPVLREPRRGARFLPVRPGLPLGVDPGARYTEIRVPRASPGSVLALFTDGLYERRGRDIDAALEDARRAVDELGHLPPETAAMELMERLARDAVDDVALLVARLDTAAGG